MTDLLHYCNRIGFFARMLAQFNKMFKQLVNVCKIKISRNYKITRHPVVLAEEGMTAVNTVLAIGSVTKMPDKKFAQIGNIFFLPVYTLIFIGIVSLALYEMLIDLGKNI